ncbi:MAG: SpoIIE family protein phosphatase [Candidatus Brocadiae bacterium]|nr:SpoIIE family protein phosphatase [Candidatus Brocadiia bacterium]
MTASKVLIIEDDATMRRALRDNFEFKGYSVTTADDGEEGLQAALHGGPDLILLDIMLPKLNGYEVCRRLRSEGVDTPVIMVTAKGQEPDLLLGLEVGADDYVTKPFSIEELLARAEALLRRDLTARQKVREHEERLRAFVEQVRTRERDLERARQFQESLMGRPSPRPGLAVAAAHRFCDTMGGDFYDILEPEPQKTGFLLADVSGHGVNAALVAGMLKVQVAASECADDPCRFLQQINAHLFHVLADTGQFLTAAYAVVCGETGDVQYANAGHNPILLVRAESGIEEFNSTGPPVGMLDELPIESGSFAMAPEDAIWLYTDGLFEPAGLTKPGSGRKWLTDMICRARRDKLDEWVEAVLAQSQRSAERSAIDDDMAVLAAVRLPE